VPGKKRKLCPTSQHVWRETKGDYEVCVNCGTRFPCVNKDCGHFDCMHVRGQEIPEYWKDLLAAMGLEVDTTTLRLPKDRSRHDADRAVEQDGEPDQE